MFTGTDKCEDFIKTAHLAESIGQTRNHPVIIDLVLPGEASLDHVVLGKLGEVRVGPLTFSPDSSEDVAKLEPALSDGGI